MKQNCPIPPRIVEGIRNGDPVAFAEYYEGVQEGLITAVARLTGDVDEAIDIAHDALIKLWENRENIDQLNGFIYTVATNASINLLRKRQVHAKYVDEQKSVQEIESTSDMESIVFDDLLARVNKIIAEMPPQRRKVFRMNRDENMTYIEIANALGISHSTVKKHIKLALSDIREALTLLALFLVLSNSFEN